MISLPSYLPLRISSHEILKVNNNIPFVLARRHASVKYSGSLVTIDVAVIRLDSRNSSSFHCLFNKTNVSRVRKSVSFCNVNKSQKLVRFVRRAKTALS